ncbi:MAG TPA: ferredoxin reductase [Actinomycetota bacterium]|nr:ferredoxin reductase [Actinomycetota bacterium]
MTDHPPVPRRGPWEMATVVEVRAETANAKTFRLALPHPSIHLAGQHYIVRLTAPDGYTASRSYSVASPPDGSAEIELTVEHLPDGEVSSFLHEVVVPGDAIEVRGPIGGWFVWRGDAPALLVGGGSGVVPLMAMLRLARRSGRSDLLRLVVSARSPADLYYAAELPGPETTIVYTRATPPSWPRPVGRLNRGDLPAPIAPDATAYVCGTPGFADAATGLLADAGTPADRIRVERFGPTR